MTTRYFATCPGFSLIASLVYLFVGILILLVECDIEKTSKKTFISCAKRQYLSFALIAFGSSLGIYPIISCFKKKKVKRERQRLVESLLNDDHM